MDLLRGRRKHPGAARFSRNLDIDGPGCYHTIGISGEIMRRRLEAFIPIVLLLIVVQLLAPIGAFRIVADAATDPLHMASICSEMASSGDDQAAPAMPQHDHGGCCAFCVAGHGGAVAVDPPPLIFAVLQRLYQRISWLESADPVPPVRVGSNAQARAPPQLT
jgi:Protein of unknown function (DUF2946)